MSLYLFFTWCTHSIPNVHDAIIVRKKDEELAKNALTKEFEAHADITPQLKLK